jgi:hypothetical protein
MRLIVGTGRRARQRILGSGQVCGFPLIGPLADAFAYAGAAGVTLRIDGTEVQVRRLQRGLVRVAEDPLRIRTGQWRVGR